MKLSIRNAALTLTAVILTTGFLTTSSSDATSVSTRASLQGSVRFEGTPPAGAAVDMSADAYCARVGSGVTRRAVEVNANGGLAGVVVHVRTRVAGAAANAAAEPVVLDQQNCMYRPTLIALRAGQPLLVRNSDETMHNVHVVAKVNRGFNLGQPRKGLESRRTFTASEIGIKVSCDVHGWMSGAIAVFDHPYFAVTDADGNFTIDGLPAGDYEVEAWHPTLGVQNTRVTMAASGGRAAFSFRGS